MDTGKNIERGRKPDDPSPQLLALMGHLQHTPPDDRNLMSISPDLYREALELIDAKGRRRECIGIWDDVVHVRFCGHLISPEDLGEPQLAS